MPKSLTSILSGFSDFIFYPCSGIDTKVFTFLHKNFLDHRGLKISLPTTFVFADDSSTVTSLLKRKRRWLHRDFTTDIEILQKSPLSSQFDYSALFDLQWTSLKRPGWGDLGSVDIKLVFIKSDWSKLYSFFIEHKFKHSVLVGVADGCRFGGNIRCVNNLSLDHVLCNGVTSAHDIKYYIADHFRNHINFGNLVQGDFVRSKEHAFPFLLKKLALLSTDWGTYGSSGRTGGATIFEVVDTSLS